MLMNSVMEASSVVTTVLTVIVAVTAVMAAGWSFMTMYIDRGGESGDCDSSPVVTTVTVASSAMMTMVTTMVAVTLVMIPRQQ